MDWQFPVYKQAALDDGRSHAVQAKKALSVEQAYAYIAGEDRRPLLVLRECGRAKQAKKEEWDCGNERGFHKNIM